MDDGIWDRLLYFEQNVVIIFGTHTVPGAPPTAITRAAIIIIIISGLQSQTAENEHPPPPQQAAPDHHAHPFRLARNAQKASLSCGRCMPSDGWCMRTCMNTADLLVCLALSFQESFSASLVSPRPPHSHSLSHIHARKGDKRHHQHGAVHGIHNTAPAYLADCLLPVRRIHLASSCMHPRRLVIWMDLVSISSCGWGSATIGHSKAHFCFRFHSTYRASYSARCCCDSGTCLKNNAL